MTDLPELNNRIIRIGNAVVMGLLPAQDAFDKIVQDEELLKLPDEELHRVLEETDGYWREQMSHSRPENLIIYPVLMADCAQVRLQALSQFAKGVDETEKAALDGRRAQWITILVQSLVAQGLALLLLPAPQKAWEAFQKAAAGARALPDFGQLRLREAIWATYGLFVAAQMGDQQRLVVSASADLENLVQVPGREQEAQEYIREIEEQLTPIIDLVQQRSAPQQAASDMASPTDSSSYNLFYLDLLNNTVDQIEAGALHMDEAEARLLQGIDITLLESKHVYFTSLFLRDLAERAPARAILLANLNYTVAHHLRDDLAELTRGYCAYALGYALVRQGRSHDEEVDSFRKAIPYLREALSILDQRGSTTGEIEQALIGLVLSYRAIGDFVEARDLSYQVIERLKRQSEHNLNLGVAYGNLADVQDQLGDTVEAFANHYRAFEIFLARKDLLRARQALGYIADLSVRTGHVDDAIAAQERLADLMVEMADFKGAAEACLSLVSHTFRVQHFQEAVTFMQRARNLLEPSVSAQQPDVEVLELYHAVLLYIGAVYSLFLEAAVEGFVFQDAYEPLERSRQIAAHLQDADRLAASLVQLAMLCHVTGRWSSAESYCQMVDMVPCGQLYRAWRDEILGNIRIRQGRSAEAIALLQQALAAYSSDQKDRRASSWSRLAEAHEKEGRFKEAVQAYEECLGLFEQSRLEWYEASRMEFIGNFVKIYEHLIRLYADHTKDVYDPRRAFYWLEKSKSRTFVETMGFSPLPLHHPPEAIQDDLREERALLQHINMLRGQLFLNSQGAPATAERQQWQRELYLSLEKLKVLWNRIKERVPEYVNLRQGLVVAWDELQVMFETCVLL